MPWFRKEDPNEIDFKPEDFKKDIETSSKAQMDALRAELAPALSASTEMANYLKEQKAERDRIELGKRQQTRSEEEEVDESLWITNPAEANRRANLPAQRQAQAAAAMVARREYLGEKEYYTGDFKEKVDALIEQQPLEARSSVTLLKNCYDIILGQHVNEIVEGKLKKNVYGVGFNGNGTGGNSGGDGQKEQDDKLAPEELESARKFGFTADEWSASKKELNYV